MPILGPTTAPFDEAQLSSSARAAIAIPTLDRLATAEVDGNTLQQHNVLSFDARNANSRPFNLLRTQLVKRLRAENWRLIGITSATPAAGKSFIASNLAAALGKLPDQQIYLFDLDLRRGSLAENFGLQTEHGLTDYLDGSINSLLSVGRKITDTNLALFPCYPARVSSAELLAGERFGALVSAMRRLPYGAVAICDLPPVFANDDAMMMVHQLDAFLLVIEEGVTTKKQVRDAMRLMSPTPCVGTILNRFSGGFGDDYGYGKDGAYDKYYS